MKQICRFALFIFCIFQLGACAQLENIDRSEVNRPAMSLASPAKVQAPASLTNLRSRQSAEVGSCTVCAH